MLLATLMMCLAAQPAPTWQQIDALIAQDKKQAALEAVGARLAAARASPDQAELARALIRQTKLRDAIGAPETALESLRKEAWPTDPLPRVLVQLFYAEEVLNYLRHYEWEIRERELVATSQAQTIKDLTAAQLRAEARRVLEAAWKDRDALGAVKLKSLPEGVVQANGYPEGIRDTVRDLVTYLRVRELEDTSGWSPEQANSVFQLDFKALVTGDFAKSKAVDLVDAKVHPLVQIGALLDDLEHWHLENRRGEAALEARIERLKVLRGSFTREEELSALRENLRAAIAADAALPFSAFARGELAEMLRTDGLLAEARDEAQAGVKAFPESMGGARCRSLVEALMAPSLQLEARSNAGVNRKSLQFRSRNLTRVYLKAFRQTVEGLQALGVHRGLQPEDARVRALLKKKADAEWTVDLPPTPDLKEKVLRVQAPFTKTGAWVVVASASADFAPTKNQLQVAVTWVSAMVLTHRRQNEGRTAEAVVVDGATGAPVKGAKVELWARNWDSSCTLAETVTSNALGVARFRDRTTEHDYFLIARNGEDFTADPQDFGFWDGRTTPDDSALIFTDRSIYRPQQKLKWKISAYRSGALGPSSVLAGRKATVSLRDPSGAEVAKAEVTTNRFGTASGEFTIPTGRLLGQWFLEVLGTGTRIRVEEYKRPTFELAFKPTTGALKLNAPATLTLGANYYFGQPVSAGRVSWVVKRAPRYPWWWFGARNNDSPVVGSGKSDLKADGTCAITFSPVADPRLAKEVTYAYTVSADLTDDGGETHSTSTTINLGQISIQAAFTTPPAFFRVGAPMKLEIVRSDLNGSPRPGQGTWKAFALEQPADASMPEDEGASVDALRTWKEQGVARASGTLTHDAQGVGALALPALARGAYRLAYETVDDFGATYRMSREFLVAEGKGLPAQLPLVNLVGTPGELHVGDTVPLLLGSAFAGQPILVEVFQSGNVRERRWVTAGTDDGLIEQKLVEADRGGLVISATVVRAFQVVTADAYLFVARDDKRLDVAFSTFRDALKPGGHETFRITVKAGEGSLAPGAAEVLASMYDQSLEALAPYSPPSLATMWVSRALVNPLEHALQWMPGESLATTDWYSLKPWTAPADDRLDFFERDSGNRGYFGFWRFRYRGGLFSGDTTLALQGGVGLGSLGTRGRGAGGGGSGRLVTALEASGARGDPGPRPMAPSERSPEPDVHAEAAAPVLRSNFAESAFFAPHLLIDDKGQAAVEFDVPDSVTAWRVWAHAQTQDLRAGSTSRLTRSVKELMVRPYLPRFLREGDEGELKVVVNNAGATDVQGELTFDLLDPESGKSVLAEFSVKQAGPRAFTAKAGQSATLTVSLKAPKRVGEVLVKVVAKAGANSDGEQRVLPLLPSRMRLTQSKFVMLKDKDSRKLDLPDLAKADDPTRVNEQLVLTVDAQLFYSVLTALPYLVRYPYECAEQTLNRFVSTGIVSRVFKDNPAISAMAKEFSARKSQLETFDALDANRKLQLEESPWLNESRGGAKDDLINMLDAATVEAERASALNKLRKMQNANGGFPWFPGGPASTHMTLYMLAGFARATEFKVEVPADTVSSAWRFVAEELRRELRLCREKHECNWSFLTFANYVASSFPDEASVSPEDRAEMLDLSFKNWKSHSTYLREQLALTLKRAGRSGDAKLVFDSVMDRAKTTQDEGTFWQPEDRAWLWYNDSVEGHAFALRTLQELNPTDPRRAGLVQWLLLNKKLGHWKSTRATAEAIYSLVKFMQADKSLGTREETRIALGSLEKTLEFDPAKYTGKRNQIIVKGAEITPAMASATVSKTTKGYQFASLTWHFSTDTVPTEARGDFFTVNRKYFKRVSTGPQVRLEPLAEGASIAVGDELEVQLSIRAKQAAQYVHLRDPRGAGFEPQSATSGYTWDLGLSWYREFRDSSTNFFFEELPAGEYTLKYRVRASMEGTFRTGPATLQSMYAPELTAYSAGAALTVKSAGK